MLKDFFYPKALDVLYRPEGRVPALARHMAVIAVRIEHAYPLHAERLNFLIGELEAERLTPEGFVAALTLYFSEYL